MTPITYLFFKDNCREAFTFYGEVFGTTPEFTPFGDQMPDVDPDLVMHAAIKIGDGQLYGSDDPSGTDHAPMAGFNISVSLPDEAETKRVYEALSKDGDIRMPLGPQFWTPLYSGFSDRFGVRWMVMQDSDYMG